MSDRIMFSTRIRAESSLPCWRSFSLLDCPRTHSTAHLKQVPHCSPLLLRDGSVFLLNHLQSADGQLELHLELGLGRVQQISMRLVDMSLTTTVDDGAIFAVAETSNTTQY